MDLNIFKNKNVNKTNILTVDGKMFTDKDIIGGISYNQTVNSGVDVVLGSCTVATIEFDLYNTSHWGQIANKSWNQLSEITWQQLIDSVSNSFAGKEITWIIRVETSPGVFEDISIGVFIAEKPTRINDGRIKVKAYDRMTKFDVIIDDWLATVVYPITLKNALIGLCDFVGVPLETTAFLNDSYIVKKNFNGINVKGRDFLKWICEIAAKYAVINELGQLKLEWYTSVDYSITNADYYSIKIDDYQTKKIDKLQVSVEENDIGVVVGTGTNAYVIQNNPLLYAETDAEIRPTVEAIYNAIKDFTYTPFEIKLNSNPLIKAGHMIIVTTRKGQVVTGVVMTRKMTNGSDVYSATGNIDRGVNKSVNQSILQIRGKTNVLERTIDATISKLYDSANGDISILTQTVSSIETRVQTNEGNVSSLIQTASDLTSMVETAEGSISAIEQNASSITLRVETAEGNITTLQQTDISLTSRIQTAEGNISTVTQNVSSLTTRISTAEGNISTVEQTANSLTTRVSSAEGNISTLTQTASSLESRVSGTEGDITSIKQTTDSITLAVNASKVIFDSNGLTINNGGFFIKNGSTILLSSTSGNLYLRGEFRTGYATLNGNGLYLSPYQYWDGTPSGGRLYFDTSTNTLTMSAIGWRNLIKTSNLQYEQRPYYSGYAHMFTGGDVRITGNLYVNDVKVN